MITLYKPEDEAEAIAITALLEANSIHSSMQSFHDTAYDGVFQGQHGWGVIKVNEVDFDAARRVGVEPAQPVYGMGRCPVVAKMCRACNAAATLSRVSSRDLTHVRPP